MAIWDFEQKLFSDLIDVFGNFLKGCILEIRTRGELTEGSDRWTIEDRGKGIEYTITFKIEKVKKGKTRKIF